MGVLDKFFKKSENEQIEDQAKLAKVHHARLEELQRTSQESASALHDINQSNQRTSQRLSNINDLMGRLDQVVSKAERSAKSKQSTQATGQSSRRSRINPEMMALLNTMPDKGEQGVQSCQTSQGSVLDPKLKQTLTGYHDYSQVNPDSYTDSPHNWSKRYHFEALEVLTGADEADNEELLRLHLDYAQRHQVDLKRQLSSLLPPATVSELKQQLQENYTYKQPQCDAYDYMIAATCGLLGGLTDIFLVSSPAEGVLTQWADDTTDSAICGFASLCGWSGPRAGADEMNSAIGFLERMFPVNYDQKFGAETGGIVDLRPADHHLKSLGHSPDLLGLFFSILDQFTNQSHFIADGGIVVMDTEIFELHGSTLLGKLFCGTANWLGHIMSDVGGSSGSILRGTGVPIPFFNLLQLADFGSFGPDQKTIAQISTQVFSQGYDLRHGMAMAIPVLFTELTIRLMYVLKSLFVKNPYPSESSVPPLTFADSPFTRDLPAQAEHSQGIKWWQELDVSRGIDSSLELRRMLFIGHGVLCLMDAGDALICGKGNLVDTLLRFNLIAWVRFSFLAVKEVKTLMLAGHIDDQRLEEDLDREYKNMLLHLRGLS